MTRIDIHPLDFTSAVSIQHHRAAAHRLALMADHHKNHLLFRDVGEIHQMVTLCRVQRALVRVQGGNQRPAVCAAWRFGGYRVHSGSLFVFISFTGCARRRQPAGQTIVL